MVQNGQNGSFELDVIILRWGQCIAHYQSLIYLKIFEMTHWIIIFFMLSQIGHLKCLKEVIVKLFQELSNIITIFRKVPECLGFFFYFLTFDNKIRPQLFHACIMVLLKRKLLADINSLRMIDWLTDWN